MSKYVNESEFSGEAKRRFEFLREWDFLGPEEGEYRLSYSSGTLSVDLLYDDRDGRVMTIVRSFVAGRSARAGLQCLYVAAKLGPAQDIREIARSPKILGAVLESHAVALRNSLPILQGSDGPQLLLKCHGR